MASAPAAPAAPSPPAAERPLRHSVLPLTELSPMRGSAPLPPGISFRRSVGATVVAGLLTAIVGCGESTESAEVGEQEKPLPTLEATVMTVSSQQWPTIVRSQGSLFADEITVVGTRVAGRVAEVHVDLGDRVEAGDELVTLEQEEFASLVRQAEAQLEQTRAAVGLATGESVDRLNPEKAPPVRQEQALWDEAKANLTRGEQLRSQQAISPEEFERLEVAAQVAETRHAAALNGVHEKIALIGVRQAELTLARQRLQDAVVRAPFDGLVQSREVAPGAYLPVGADVVVLVRANPLRFRGTVPERYASQLAVGQEVHLQIESVAEPRTVQIVRVSPSLDQRSRSLAFEAVVDNAGNRLRTGLFAEAQVVIDPQAETLVVPHSAVVEFAGTEKVWKVDQGVAKEQSVVLGTRRTGGIEVREGLSDGDVILIEARKGRVAKVVPVREETEWKDADETAEMIGETHRKDAEPAQKSPSSDEPSVAAAKLGDVVPSARQASANGGR